MTTPVFITGDRQYALPYLTQVPIEMMRAMAQGRPIWTGANPAGVEDMVRQFAHEVGVTVNVVEHSAVEGHPTWGDWTKRHASLPEGTTFVAIHVDPMSDTLTKLLLEEHPDTSLVLPV